MNAYQKLARHLDNLPGGYPPTDSGVELRILRRLFNQNEALLAVKLTLIPEQAKVVARRAGLKPEEATRRLDEMAKKGLIFRYEDKGTPYYMAAQYVIGIWEYQVNDLDPELIADMNEYVPALFDVHAWKSAPQLRTIPVGRSLNAEHEVMDYERAEAIIKRPKKLLVAPCICRREHKLRGEGCDRPEETCLVFGMGVDYYENNGLGRRIDVEEALAILKKADKAGLVLQPSNSQKVINICCCCGCCCHVLKSMKRHPRPAELVASPFIVRLEADKCTGCEVCVGRCQMDALSMKNELTVLNASRCIGCGLCVGTCPGKALTLARKPSVQQPLVPRNAVENILRLGRVRGKIKPHTLALAALKSKVDRLLAGTK
ncbi:4Fe-4S ferredoxin-type domain-containing protein [Desulfarculales bacterium]